MVTTKTWFSAISIAREFSRDGVSYPSFDRCYPYAEKWCARIMELPHAKWRGSMEYQFAVNEANRWS